MIKAAIRFFLISICIFIDGIITIFFDHYEIINYVLSSKAIKKDSSREQEILVKYLENCHKQIYKEDKLDNKKKKRSNKKTDG